MNTFGLFSEENNNSMLFPNYHSQHPEIMGFVYLTKSYNIVLWGRRRSDFSLYASPCHQLSPFEACRKELILAFLPRMNQPLYPWVSGKFPGQHPAT